MHILARSATIALLAMAGACTAGPDRGSDTLEAHDWQAFELGATAISTPVPVTLLFSEGRASGRSG